MNRLNILQHFGYSVALEHGVSNDHRNDKQRTSQRADEHEHKLCLRRVVDRAFRSNDFEIESEIAREIEHVEDDGRPRDGQETDGHEPLHADQETFQ